MAFMSRAEVAGKVAWEGGLDEALRYGLRSDDMPRGDTELREAWDEMELAFHVFEQKEALVEDLLPSEDEYEEF